jgi:hypothetical protein
MMKRQEGTKNNKMNQASDQWRFIDSHVNLDSGGNFHDDLARFCHSK